MQSHSPNIPQKTALKKNQATKRRKRLEMIFPFMRHPAFRFMRFIITEFEQDRCREKAASLTYTTMLSIVPMFTVLIVILSSVPALQQAKGQIQQLIYDNLMPSSGFQVSSYINDFAKKSTSLTLIGVVILFITTIMMLSKIEDAFNRIWHVPDSGNDIVGLMRYWTLMSLGPIVLGTAFIMSSTIASLSFLNQQIAGYAIDWAISLKIMSFLLTLLGFTAIYWFVPNTRVPIKSAAIAGCTIGVVFETLKTAFGSIMANFTSYELIYGAFAALPVFLLWIYLSWCLILLGVQISYAISVFETRDSTSRHPLFILLDMLHLLHTNQTVGKTTSEHALKAELGRSELTNWHHYKTLLADQGLITETSDGHYVLQRNLSHISLWDFYKLLPYPLPHRHDVTEVGSSSVIHNTSDKTNDFINDETNRSTLTDVEPWQKTLNHSLLQSDRFLSKKLSTSLADLFETDNV